MMPLATMSCSHPSGKSKCILTSTVYLVLIHKEGETMSKHDDQVSF